MKVETKFFGTLEVDEERIIHFTTGLPGFEQFQQYFLMPYNNESPFLVMQSVEQSSLAFIIIGLEMIVPNYTIDLTDEIVAELKLAKPEEVVVYAITVIPDDLAKATVNLAAPVVINCTKKLGKQIILNNPEYSLKYPLFSSAPVKEAQQKTGVK